MSGLVQPLHQIDDQPELLGPAEKRVLLGDLQPNQSRTLHVWTDSPYTMWNYARLPSLFEITADEIDKRVLKLPFPSYLKSLLLQRLKWASIYFAVAYWVLLALAERDVIRNFFLWLWKLLHPQP
jgi:cellulose synthase/poly-beta-1,6-N-acetylglucosamine synthase-like glycosyltransferase